MYDKLRKGWPGVGQGGETYALSGTQHSRVRGWERGRARGLIRGHAAGKKKTASETRRSGSYRAYGARRGVEKVNRPRSAGRVKRWCLKKRGGRVGRINDNLWAENSPAAKGPPGSLGVPRKGTIITRVGTTDPSHRETRRDVFFVYKERGTTQDE